MTKQESMFTQIEKWKKSGTIASVFCREHQLNEHVFYYWRNKYKQHSTTEKPNDFITLNIEESSVIPDQIHINYANGNTISLPSGTDIDLIRSLVQL